MNETVESIIYPSGSAQEASQFVSVTLSNSLVKELTPALKASRYSSASTSGGSVRSPRRTGVVTGATATAAHTALKTKPSPVNL